MKCYRNLLITLLISASLIIVATGSSLAASLPASSALVNSSNGAYIRSSCSTSAKKVTSASNNASLTVLKEVVASSSSTASKKRWYQVQVNGKTGYIRSDLVDNNRYPNWTGKTTTSVNYRTGPSTSFKKKGTLKKGTTVKVLIKSNRRGKSEIWYKVQIGNKKYYISSKYVALQAPASSAPAQTQQTQPNQQVTSPQTAPQPVGPSNQKSALANAILSKPTDGNTACRVVYTFDTSNCSKKFEVKGYGSTYTPQGLSFTGDLYTLVFGNDSAQSIVKYDKNGNRFEAFPFSFNMGHPNGITYNPNTDMYYIFKGNQYDIYTCNPKNDTFGKATTPYQSSGVGYDPITNTIVASSRTGMREYTADGKFTHRKLLYRCTHSGTHYVQDCCAYGGLVFHGVSGSNKATENYIDIYRMTDSKYLGSIKLTIGEIESMVVNGNGYLELLINTSSHDYIWNTPLNVNELIY